jgi:hypothetical protein
MTVASSWICGFIWSDDHVDGERLLLLPSPAGLNGQPVVVRASAGQRSVLARVERSDRGYEGRVHPWLARQLGGDGERFEAKWRRARWYDVLWLNRTATLAILLTALVAGTAAVISYGDSAKKVGWGLAVLALAAGIGALAVTARQEWNKLKP